MKRTELDELEGKRQEKSCRVGVAALAGDGGSDDVMNENMEEVMRKLTPTQQERARMLWDELVDLRVKPGIRNRLMGMGHMGALNDPIWKYIYKLRTGAAKKVRDRGSWLIKCLLTNNTVSN